MTHHCTISKNGLKMYFIGPRRVSKDRFFMEFPEFNDELCVASNKRRKIRESIKILKSIEKDLGQDGPLSLCEKRLEKCNQRISGLEFDLLRQTEDFKNKLDSLSDSANSKKECLQNLSFLEKEMKKRL